MTPLFAGYAFCQYADPPPLDCYESYRDVYQLQPERVAHEIVCEHRSALQARVCPSAAIRVGYVELRYGDGVDLV